MSDKIFVDGMIVKESKYSTKLSIKVEEFAQFVKEHADKGWLNLEVKTSKGGKMYACLDTWKPDASKEAVASDDSDDLPF